MRNRYFSRLAGVAAAAISVTVPLVALTSGTAGASVTYTVSIQATLAAAGFLTCPTQQVTTINTAFTSHISCTVVAGTNVFAARITFQSGGAILRSFTAPTTVEFVGTVLLALGTTPTTTASFFCWIRPNSATPELVLSQIGPTTYAGSAAFAPVTVGACGVLPTGTMTAVMTIT